MKESISTQLIPSIASIRASLAQTESKLAPEPALALPSEALLRMNISEIPFSCCKIAEGSKSGKATSYILEIIKLRHPDMYQQTKKDVRDLARRLHHDEPRTFGLLGCKGFIAERADLRNGSPAQFTLISRIPSGFVRPRSLRGLLQHTKPSSLSDKLLIAQELAKSVAYVHVFGFVHKGIRPESIIIFGPVRRDSSSLFLVGFEDFRKEDGRTQRLGDNTIERNLYRHPSRQGASPGSNFTIQHDIFSLGVCLLELGLWQSFIECDPKDQRPILSPLLGGPPVAPKENSALFILESVQTRLIDLTQTQLPKCMGTRYSEIAETCLRCLDPENSEFSDQEEFEDEDGVMVGVRYIEKVSTTLEAFNPIQDRSNSYTRFFIVLIVCIFNNTVQH
jgi:hypothetical protein